ncbi:GroES-like protein [Hyaloscypha bicolor E]|uniref:GroES-like protein n=1 Tax=Hyaloscypha bicolor E TaxID=1095630 RepID=A0A2J6TBJ5_9HELO|nr:GroES-like protein [Hyaloscypha bicolor E]PMD60399.1 GroES-like protein [Hyaloscypha bicolor E]
MKGIQVEKVGGSYDYVEEIVKPSPEKNQILVKSLVTAINPVEPFMQGTGMLVLSWPIVLGCDASGVVAEVGEGVSKFKIGDKVFGCTRLGHAGYGTFQEFFLMDENLAFKNEGNLSLEEAATVGVGVLTACLGLIRGLKMSLVPKKVDDSSEWVIIIGAAGAVGSFAVQIAHLCGYKVLAACPPSAIKLVESLGADATYSHRLPPEDQLKEIALITGGKFLRVFDASAFGAEVGMAALAKHGDPNAKPKYFSTTNDWIPIDLVEGIEIDLVTLGAIGKSGDEHQREVTAEIAAFIPQLEKLLGNGKLKPIEYEVVGAVGFKEVLKALDVYNNRKGSTKKIVVRVADE